LDLVGLFEGLYLLTEQSFLEMPMDYKNTVSLHWYSGLRTGTVSWRQGL